MKTLIIVFLMLISIVSFAQKHLVGSEISFTTLSMDANYEGFVSDHFSLGAKLGFLTIGAKTSYYFAPITTSQWNGHIGLRYELTGAVPITSFIWGPTFVGGVERISKRGIIIALEGGAMVATYGDTSESNRNPIYPMINIKLARLLQSKSKKWFDKEI